MIVQEEKQQSFHCIKGDIDRRDKKQTGDLVLGPGYQNLCGQKGGKLSGGQK